MCVHVSVAYRCRWLAYTLVCVNVALAVRAGVCHILEVVDQTGNQAAAQIAPVEENRECGDLILACSYTVQSALTKEELASFAYLSTSELRICLLG